MQIVAVYGSLRKGFGNHGFLKNQSFKGTDIVPNYKMYSLGAFPGIVPDDGGSIFAEIYEVDEETFKALDRLEGHPNFYCRRQVSTVYGPAWIYELANVDHYRGLPLVVGGEWGK